MHRKKSKTIFIYIFLLIVVSSISNDSINSLKLIKIKNIKISGLEQKDNKFILDKKYPSTININIEKTNFLAKINNNGKIFLIGSNGKLISAQKNYNDLPFIFGKPKIEEFLKFKQILDNSNFSYNQIESLYFYPSKRWDLKFKENILLKLPNNFSFELLNNLYEFLENYTVKNFTIIDSRIKNQIILNE